MVAAYCHRTTLHVSSWPGYCWNQWFIDICYCTCTEKLFVVYVISEFTTMVYMYSVIGELTEFWYNNAFCILRNKLLKTHHFFFCISLYKKPPYTKFRKQDILMFKATSTLAMKCWECWLCNFGKTCGNYESTHIFSKMLTWSEYINFCTYLNMVVMSHI